MNTDQAWEDWGKKDPYFSVFTNQKYRLNTLNDEAKAEFFEIGRLQSEYILQVIHKHVDPHFQAKSAMDFGCGVGRVVIPLARSISRVVGLDVSLSMLAEAKKNATEQNVANAAFLQSDDTLSNINEQFDLVHSFIVFQHIPTERGRKIFAALLAKIAPGGVGAVQFLYSKKHFADNHGMPPPTSKLGELIKQLRPPGEDPEMQMNPYMVNELFFLMQGAGIQRFHTEFTDHGGELGVYFFFQLPASA
jgi:cyclopropane fatty-acyl-phospholipid synthase-like methyltransferase